MKIEVNGKTVTPAPVTLIVAPFNEIPNLPPGFIEESRWTDGTGTTTIRCWPSDPERTRMARPYRSKGQNPTLVEAEA